MSENPSSPALKESALILTIGDFRLFSGSQANLTIEQFKKGKGSKGKHFGKDFEGWYTIAFFSSLLLFKESVLKGRRALEAIKQRKNKQPSMSMNIKIEEKRLKPLEEILKFLEGEDLVALQQKFNERPNKTEMSEEHKEKIRVASKRRKGNG